MSYPLASCAFAFQIRERATDARRKDGIESVESVERPEELDERRELDGFAMLKSLHRRAADSREVRELLLREMASRSMSGQTVAELYDDSLIA